MTQKVIHITYFIMLIIIISCSSKQPSFNLFFSEIRATCVTFVRPGDIDHYIGYRIVEYKPEITDYPISNYGGQPKRKNYPPPSIPDTTLLGPTIPEGMYTKEWLTKHQSERRYFRSYNNGVAYFRYKENEGLYRVVVLKAVADGVEIWAWLESEEEIAGSFIVQACFRLSGDTNSPWRHGMAIVPELSEYDLWSTGDTLSLTYVRKKDEWQNVEPKKEKITFYTSAGLEHLQQQQITIDDNLIVPHGLIIRESIDGTSVAGMYWDRTVKVSNHQPADCLHAYVDLGPVKPGAKKIVHGKIYWFNGNKDDLLRHWQKDFTQ
jgi:hypothetical protein